MNRARMTEIFVIAIVAGMGTAIGAATYSGIRAWLESRKPQIGEKLSQVGERLGQGLR